jgi:acylphosphatase
MATQQLHAVVHGRVQGVSFRYNTVLRANELGITGWVRNLPERTVEVTAEGPREQLDMLIEYLKVGPTGARVTGVDIEWLDASGQYSEFSVR